MAIPQAVLVYFSYEFKKTAANVLNVGCAESKKMADRVVDKDTSVVFVDIVFNTKRERIF